MFSMLLKQPFFQNIGQQQTTSYQEKKAMKASTSGTQTTVFDVNQAPQTLAAMLAKGGEGEIYPLHKRPGVLVKRYFDDKLQKNGRYLEKKIEAMRALRSHFAGLNTSWPAISVYNDNQQWIGYAMKKVEGKTFRSLAHAMLYKTTAPNLNRKDVTTMMLDWLESIEKLHANGVMIGDYNLSNFMWDPKTLKVGFIDCDSYQIKAAGLDYRCLVGSPDLTAPEHHGKNFNEVVRTPESEYFSIAIILFMCFMLGRHPYDIVDGEDPVTNLRNGQFAYGEGNNGKRNIPKGAWYNIWSHMSYNMKSLFIRTFTEGPLDPSKRATISEWKDVLKVYLRELDKGFHDSEMKPAHPKSAVRK